MGGGREGMRCNWCGEGEGRNYTYDKKLNRNMYYFCSVCIGDFKKELNPKKRCENNEF